MVSQNVIKKDTKQSIKCIEGDRNGLVVIAGSQSVVTDFWKNKGLKKI